MYRFVWLQRLDLNQRPLGYELCHRVISIRYFEGGPVQIAAQCGIARNPGATGSLSLEVGSWGPVCRLHDKRFQGGSNPRPRV